MITKRQYNTLDAWVAWERDFPIGALKNVLLALEKEQQWHRIIQVIKWMLSKGQGNTRGTYGQLIEALDKDRRVGEAHEIWNKKLGFDLHSVPWKLCKLMISVYCRNNMHENVVKLFKDLEGNTGGERCWRRWWRYRTTTTLPRKSRGAFWSSIRYSWSLDMAVMVEAQGEKMDDIEHHVMNAAHYVSDGTKSLRFAEDHHKSSRKCLCIGIILLLVLILVAVIPIATSFSKS